VAGMVLIGVAVVLARAPAWTLFGTWCSATFNALPGTWLRC